jgi:hypothetical protein
MDEHAYFRAIEERFIELRGAPLLLSPADFQVAKRWWSDQVPLDVVRAALDDVFARRAERSPGRPVQSLRYCAAAVDAAWKRASELQRTDRRQEAEPIQVDARLAQLAAAIPAELPGAAELRSQALALDGAAEAVEAGLADLDGRMLAAAELVLTNEAREALEARLESNLGQLGNRLPRAEIEAARRSLFEQALRRELGLPVLSLFAGG